MQKIVSLLIFIALTMIFSTKISSLPDPIATESVNRRFGPFKNPKKLQILGYTKNAMEPAISKNNEFLIFNDEKDPNKDLFWAKRTGPLTFQFMGEVKNVNSKYVDASPCMDESGNLYFTSLKFYPNKIATMFKGQFLNGLVKNPKIIAGGLYQKQLLRVSLDPDVTPSGSTLYFVQGHFAPGKLPESMDIRIAQKVGGEYRILDRSDEILVNINTGQHLEFAPSITADNLELFFTQIRKSFFGIVTNAVIYQAIRKKPTDPFGKPERIGAITGFAEGPSISRDGTTLYYHKKDESRFFIYVVSRNRL